MLGLETVNAADGATLTRDQAVRRWAFLFGPQVVASVFQFSGSVSNTLGSLGSLLGLAAFIYADLPAVHGDPEPQAPGLPRRPGRHGRRQARLIPRQPSTPRRGRPRRPRFDSGLEVQRPHVTRAEHRERPPVEGRDAADRQPLGRRDQQRVGEPRPVLGRLAQQLRCAGEVLGRRWDDADRAGHDRREHRPHRVRPELALQAAGRARASPSAPSSSGSSTRSNQATAARWLRSAVSAAASDRGRVEQDRHSAVAGPAAGLPPRDRAPVERQPPVRAAADAQERELGRRLVRVQPRLEGRRDDRRLGRVLALDVPVEPVEQVGVEQDRGPDASSYDVIYTTVDGPPSPRPPSGEHHPRSGERPP